MQLVTNVITFPPLNTQTGSCVDNRLKRTQIYGARRIDDTVTVIHTTDDEVVDERFCRLVCKSSTDGAELTKLIKARSSHQALNVCSECELAVGEDV